MTSTMQTDIPGDSVWYLHPCKFVFEQRGIINLYFEKSDIRTFDTCHLEAVSRNLLQFGLQFKNL